MILEQRSEIRDGMRIDWDVPIEMDDGLVLRADVFRPVEAGRWPVILSYGPYAKGLAFQEGYPSAWQIMTSRHPDVAAGSTNKYQNWEVVDPEKWVPDGYVCVRVDSRGCGNSPGFVDHFSARETRDYAACIEWAGTSDWSNGKVGLNGISYYGINQWQVASTRPKHLAAMCIWEGSADWYRDMTHHGGILSTFWANWYDMQIKTVQYGLGSRGPKNPVTGAPACGAETLSDEQLARNRSDFGAEIRAHLLDDAYHRERSAQWDRITVPFLSAANWGGQGLHPRGNFEGFVRAASAHKWLEVHGQEHWTEFYTDYGVGLQKRFFDYFLKGADNGWDRQARVKLQVRHVDRFEERDHDAWPLPETRWTKYYLDPDAMTLTSVPPSGSTALSFAAADEDLTFLTEPLRDRCELTGPSALKLRIASSTPDADLFIVLRVFDADGEEVVFQGAIDPNTPIAQGWLRASHRKLDAALTVPWRPYHRHDERQPLTPGSPVDLAIEIWPTSIVVRPGYRIGVTVRGRDYEYAKASGARLSNFKNELRGCGPFLHNDPEDRPPATFCGETTVHFTPESPAELLLPVIPSE